MKKNITYVRAEKFAALVSQYPQLGVTQNSGFIKVELGGRRLYVAKTKNVGRIDVSGYVTKVAGVRDLGDDRFGNVTGQVDFTRNETDILITFEALLEELVSSPAIETKAKVAAAQVWAFRQPGESPMMLNDE